MKYLHRKNRRKLVIIRNIIVVIKCSQDIKNKRNETTVICKSQKTQVNKRSKMGYLRKIFDEEGGP